MRPSSSRGTDDVTPVPSRLDHAPTRIVSSRTTLVQHLRDIWTYRELLRGLVRKELQVKYKNSVVGVGWSMVNPAMTLAVFYFVFQIVLKNGIPYFAIYLMCGLLVWNLFSTALPSATGAVVGNAAIVKKVAFPREILALASVGASLQFFFYQVVVMLLALVVFRFVPSFSYMPLLVPALLTLLMFTAALGVFLAAMNVYFRDIQHLLEVVMTAWFWATPIVYTYRNIADRLGAQAWVFRLNPITPIVLSFQRALYAKISPPSTTGSGPVAILPAHAGRLWYLAQLLGVMGGSVLLFLGAVAVFARVEGNFAEEL